MLGETPAAAPESPDDTEPAAEGSQPPTATQATQPWSEEEEEVLPGACRVVPGVSASDPALPPEEYYRDGQARNRHDQSLPRPPFWAGDGGQRRGTRGGRDGDQVVPDTDDAPPQSPFPLS